LYPSIPLLDTQHSLRSIVATNCHHRSPHSFPTRRSSDLCPSDRVGAAGGVRRVRIPLHSRRVRRDHPPDRRDRAPARRGPDLDRDRKSTRLNSSHGSISYAVFCLKKKNVYTEKTTNHASI